MKKQNIILLLCIVILLVVGEVFFGLFSSAWGIKMNYFTEYTNYLAEILPVILYIGVAGIIVMFKKDINISLLLLLALVIPFYFICFHVYMLSMRYLYFFMPIIIILFAYSVTFICDTLANAVTGGWKRKPQSGTEPLTAGEVKGSLRLKKCLSPALAVIIIGLSLPGAGFGFLPQSHHYLEWTAPQPDFKLAYSFINANLDEGDIIIDTWPAVGSFYLDQSPDFWLAFNIAGVDVQYCVGEGQSREIYTNISCIKEASELEEVVNTTQRGWLVIDRLASYKLSYATIDFIEEHLTYYEEGSSEIAAGTIKVYGWDNENTTSEDTNDIE